MNDNNINRKLLSIVLIINLSFFLIEIIAGIVYNSMGLAADSLDMLADAFVYGLSLLVIGKALIHKKRVAKISGYLQLTLVLMGFIEIIRRVIGTGDIPDYKVMIIVSIFALCGNAASLYILQKSKSNEVHIKASMIFTSNDVIINIGIITAGVLVLLVNSNIPDLIIGGIVFAIVLRGSLKILKLGSN
jgi:Co/Zn/Cd efflux system component